MKLTQKQEWLVARYLRAFAEALGELPNPARENAVNQLRARLAKELDQLDSFEDEAVLNRLKQIGHPTVLAKNVLEEQPTGSSFALAVDDRVWLGVCGGLARCFKIESRQVRWMAVVLGATGPIALTAYLVLYFVMYASSKRAAKNIIPGIAPLQLAKDVSVTIVILVALSVTASALQFGVEKAYLFGLKKSLPDLGDWCWLNAYKGSLSFWASLTLIPMAAFSALPAANEWNTTAKRLVQAGLCLYALVICAGLASYIVGAILKAAEALAGGLAL